MSNNTNNETKELSLEELVSERFSKEELFSPYGMWKIVQQMLDDLTLNKELPPQMFYNYAKKQFIKNDENKKISREECIRWSVKYISKQYK